MLSKNLAGRSLRSAVASSGRVPGQPESEILHRLWRGQQKSAGKCDESNLISPKVGRMAGRLQEYRSNASEVGASADFEIVYPRRPRCRRLKADSSTSVAHNRSTRAFPGLMYPVEEPECRRVKTRLPSKGRAGRGAEAQLYHDRHRLQQLRNRSKSQEEHASAELKLSSTQNRADAVIANPI